MMAFFSIDLLITSDQPAIGIKLLNGLVKEAPSNIGNQNHVSGPVLNPPDL